MTNVDHTRREGKPMKLGPEIRADNYRQMAELIQDQWEAPALGDQGYGYGMCQVATHFVSSELTVDEATRLQDVLEDYLLEDYESLTGRRSWRGAGYAPDEPHPDTREGRDARTALLLEMAEALEKSTDTHAGAR